MKIKISNNNVISTKAEVGPNAVALVDAALKNRLYVSGWTLSETLKRIRKTPKPLDIVSLTFVDGEPVSVVVLTEGSNTISSFTKKIYRKNGLAKIAVETLKKTSDGIIIKGHCDGAKGCTEFFKKCGLDIAEYWTGE